MLISTTHKEERLIVRSRDKAVNEGMCVLIPRGYAIHEVHAAEKYSRSVALNDSKL